MISFGKQTIDNYPKAVSKEWLITNGLGGYASSTIIGVNSRKYHGLLVVPLNLGERKLLLSKLEEEVLVDGERYPLSTNEYPNMIYPQGYRHLREFRLDPFPTFVYSISKFLLKKTVFMPYQQNATVVSYSVWNALESPAEIRIFPLVNSRNFHGETRKDSISWNFEQKSYDSYTRVNASYDSAPPLFLGSDLMSYTESELPESERWYKNMKYAQELERGLGYLDDHYNPGFFELELKQGKSEFNLLAAGGMKAKKTFKDIYSRKTEKFRMEQEKALQRCKKHENSIDYLIEASDSFIIPNHIIAGYHWFYVWGRDTMIALPGLTLATGRFKEARKILLQFAKYCKKGLMPNRIPELEYNSVDTPLLFFYTVYKYLTYTNDKDFAKEIWKTLKLIIDNYIEGTSYGIKADSDSLITAGDGRVQLTWMDVKIGDTAVSPRNGKAVEVNALWYNALKIAEVISKKIGERFEYEGLAQIVHSNFASTFWNSKLGCLHDFVRQDFKDEMIRPNQIFAISLPFQLLNKTKGKKILSILWEELLTPYGLRSLARGPGYIGKYEGDVTQRDLAYHHGTVWAWLIGPFITAFVKINDYSEDSRKVAAELLSPLLNDHLRDAGLGTISEIFDGDEPHTPRGCISQAWSVGEVLRCYIEDVLNRRPEFEEEYK